MLGSLVLGRDGNLWFIAQGAGGNGVGIGRITPGGEIAEFNECLHYGLPFSGPTGLAAAPDGNLWFTSVTSRSLPSISEPPTIGRITPQGEITQFRGGIESEPDSLVVGPDGAAWFAGGYQIERILPSSAPVNTFVVRPVREDAGKGSVRLPVEVPGPGALELRQTALVLPHRRRVKVPNDPAATATAPSCGSALLPLRLRGAIRARLRNTGRARIRVTIAFTPSGGTSNTQSATVFLHKRGR